ncbi:MAG: methyl-accepting chemotaxis protein [Archangiaceae bacterium]|nr:methyl-accepting chemotaxis protein [Archangiaceae bacterium]
MTAARFVDRRLWLLTPGLFSVLTQTAVSIAYVHYSRGGAASGLLVVGGVGASLMCAAWCWSRLDTLGKISAGALPADRKSLQQVAQQIDALADRVAGSIAVGWTAVVVLVALVQLARGLTTVTAAGQLTLSTLPFGALAVVLGHVATTLRARQLIGELPAQGLPVVALIEALPPGRRPLRGRVLVFALTLALAPACIALDAAFSSAREQPLVLVGMGLAVLLTIIAGASFAARTIAEPLELLAESATRLAAGDLRAATLVPADGEVWSMSRAFSTVQRQMTEVLAELKRAAIQISAAAEQMLAMTSKSKAGSTEQAAAVRQTTSTTEELARTAAEIAESATTVAATASETLAAARSGEETSKRFVDSMSEMRSGSRSISKSVGELSGRVQQIGRIAEFINSVADRSDLLALNAELEGSKAGEVGSSFSLVATEMRRLAENVIRSTREIEQLIGEVRDATEVAVAESEKGVKATDGGAQLAEQVTASLQKVFALAQRGSETASLISAATQLQQSNAGELVEAMGNVRRVSEQGVDSIKQLASSSDALAGLAREMRAVVESFQVEG